MADTGRGDLLSIDFMRGALSTLSITLITTGAVLAVTGPTHGAWRVIPFLLVAGPGALLARIVALHTDRKEASNV